MKRARSNVGGKSKKRKMNKGRGLMGKINKKIQKAITKNTEIKLRSTSSVFTINSFTGTSNRTLPNSQWILVTATGFWPPVSNPGAYQYTRVGNSLKKCITYFKHHFRLYSNAQTTTAGNLNEVRIRVIIFAMAEFVNSTADIPDFFQFNTAQVDPLLNPTNKARITVLSDYIIDRGPNPNMAFGQSTAYKVQKTVDRKTTRRFKEVLFDSENDTIPKRPYRHTYMTAFGSNNQNGTVSVADVVNISRCYWVD